MENEEENKQLVSNNLPKHIAVIMDGNGRWAKKKGAMRIFGHQQAVKSVREVVYGCGELSIPYLTLFAFSTENWSRPKDEVNALMVLLVHTIQSELAELHKNNVKLNAIGNLDALPLDAKNELFEAIEYTQKNSGLVLTLALNYSGKWDLLQAFQKLKESNISIEEIDETTIDQYLHTYGIPDPELLIRTSGELRISNFMLWQLAYTELFFTNVLWPDFRKKHLLEAIHSFQLRERRFGKTSEQIEHV